MRFQNGCNKVVIELSGVQFWSEIILLISNRTRAARSFDFEITRMISDQIALHSVQLPLFIHENGIFHLALEVANSTFTFFRKILCKIKKYAAKAKRFRKSLLKAVKLKPWYYI